MDKISIALCTHNSHAYLREQLDSFVVQLRPADEVVVVDDCSRDSTLEILAEYAGRLPLKVYPNPAQLGFVKSFERALSLCGGDFIFLSDHDDVWDKDKLSSLMEALESAEKPDLVFSDSRLVDAQGKPLAPSFWQTNGFTAQERALFLLGEPRRVLLRKAVAAGNTVGMRKELLARALPIPEHWYHDEWLLAFAAVCGKITLVERVLLSYRQHNRQAIGVQHGFLGRLKKRMHRAGGRKWQDFAHDREKWKQLEARCAKEGQALPDLRAKVRFHESCAVYPRLRLLRLLAVAKNLVLGNYARFGSGWSTALKDAIAP